ncbi:MAG TPA: hypothetical protein VMP11_04795 [Verrucomicrobiae bacterium]|nr:hypothetical protein [Verrucomicrobiae bacterium]
MHRQKVGLRAEYRDQESERVRTSPSLADKFRKLKSLTADVGFYSPDGVAQKSQLKYVVNLEHAKSVFRFQCPNSECIQGDFDLTDKLASAVAQQQTVVSGEISCQGWQSKTTIDSVHCHNIMRYKLTLAY